MRIVSLVPHATELLFALGAGPDVVGVTHECDFPSEATALPRVTRDVLPEGCSAAEIDAAVRERTQRGESIYELAEDLLASLEPDLIVAQALCSVCAVSYQDVATLAKRVPTSPRVVSLDPRTFGETLADAERLGRLTDRRFEARALAVQTAARVDRVEDAVRGAPRPRVAAIEWFDPLYVAGHWTPQLIELAGGVDVAGLPGEPSHRVEWSWLAAMRPEVVLAIPCGYGPERAREEALGHADRVAGLDADRVVALDASAYFSRPGPRLIDGLELLAHVLHPDRLPTPAAAVLAIDPGAVAPRA